MERESFEDPATAAFLNEHFVAIKVDREERPDLDAIYMDAVQAMTGSGGWPMSVFLTPDGRPFYGGTYFPNTPPPRHAGLPRRSRRGRERVARATRGGGVVGDEPGRPRRAPAFAWPTARPPSTRLSSTRPSEPSRPGFDARHGGWGSAPKFPQPMAIDFLLRRAARRRRPARCRWHSGRSSGWPRAGSTTSWPAASPATRRTRRWLVPHFEKMLYDNAQLARVYLHAWALTCDPAHLRVATETLDFVAREMTLAGRRASRPASTRTPAGEEGATYAWTADEVREVLAGRRPREAGRSSPRPTT